MTNWLLPYLAICVAFMVMIIDGGTGPAALVSASSILLITFVWRFRASFVPSSAGVFLALFLALAFFTTLPLPDLLLKAAGKEASSHHTLARAALSESSEKGLTEKAGWFQVSRNRAGTMRAVLLLTIMTTGAALTRALSEKQRLSLLLTVGTALAALGVVGMLSIHFLPQGKTFWWVLPVEHGRPVACFVNRNHFGGTMAVAAAAMLSLCCRTIKDRFAVGIISGIAFIVLASAVIGSFSRGAVLSLGCGLAAAIVLNLKKRPLILALALALFGIIVTVMLTLGGEGRLRTRLKSLARPLATTSAGLRIDTWKESLPIVKHYPLFGTGLNGYRAVFPQHRSSTTRKVPHNVENEYIQIPVESGIAGSALLIASLLMLLNPMFKPAGRTALLGAALPGLVVASAHAFIDFAVRVPFYALLVAVLAGLCISKAHLTQSRRAGIAALACILPAALTVILLSCIAPQKTFSLDSPNALGHATPETLKLAIESSPSYWQAYYNLGRTAAYRPETRDLAERHITRAADLDPLNYRLLIELALLRVDMGNTEGALDAYSRAKHLRNWLSVEQLESALRQKPAP